MVDGKLMCFLSQLISKFIPLSKKTYFLYQIQLAKIPRYRHRCIQVGSLFITPLAEFDCKFKFAIQWLLGSRDELGRWHGIAFPAVYLENDSLAHPGCTLYQTSC